MKTNKTTAWKAAFRAALPLCISYIPVGLACGVLLQTVGFNPLFTALISILVFSGGVQFLVASMLSVKAPFLSILTMTFFLSLRYTLLSSSLSTFMRKETRGFIALFTQSLNDENYAINYLSYTTDPTWNKEKALFANWFSLSSWAISNVIGTLLGSQVHLDDHLIHFALTAMFLYMFTMQLKKGFFVFIGVLAGGLSVGLTYLCQHTIGMIIATLIASFIGFAIERAWRRAHANLPAHEQTQSATDEVNIPLSPMMNKEAYEQHE